MTCDPVRSCLRSGRRPASAGRAATKPLLLFVVLLAVLSAALGIVAGATTASTATFTYDAQTVARVDAPPCGCRHWRPALLSVALKGSASPPSPARSTSATPHARSVATTRSTSVRRTLLKKRVRTHCWGAFAGAPRSQIVGQLQSGALTAADVPVEVIVRNGQTLILNTRSATALAGAGIPRTSETTGQTVIGFAPDIPEAAWAAAAREGVPIARTLDELIALITELGQ